MMSFKSVHCLPDMFIILLIAAERKTIRLMDFMHNKAQFIFLEQMKQNGRSEMK